MLQAKHCNYFARVIFVLELSYVAECVDSVVTATMCKNGRETRIIFTGVWPQCLERYNHHKLTPVKREQLDGSEIITGGYNTPDTVVRDWMTTWVMK